MKKISQGKDTANSRVVANYTLYGTMDWFKNRKGVCQGCIWSPLYAYYNNANTGLNESQARIKIARFNSVQLFSCVQLFATHGQQYAKLP